MMEAAIATLLLFSTAIFIAHAYDAVRSGLLSKNANGSKLHRSGLGVHCRGARALSGRTTGSRPSATRPWPAVSSPAFFV